MESNITGVQILLKRVGTLTHVVIPIVTYLELIMVRHDLSNVEQKHLWLVLRGLQPKEIAIELKATYPSMKHQLRRIYAKLGVRDYRQLFAKLLPVSP